jgi:hypothetical protein
MGRMGVWAYGRKGGLQSALTIRPYNPPLQSAQLIRIGIIFMPWDFVSQEIIS